jgi:hypothetical protein
MVITCAKLLKKPRGLKVMEGTQNVDFYTFGLDLEGGKPIIALCTCSYDGDKSCHVIF